MLVGNQNQNPIVADVTFGDRKLRQHPPGVLSSELLGALADDRDDENALVSAFLRVADFALRIAVHLKGMDLATQNTGRMTISIDQFPEKLLQVVGFGSSIQMYSDEGLPPYL